MKVNHSKNKNQLIQRKITELDDNVAREYLKSHPTQKLSKNYLKKTLNIKREKMMQEVKKRMV